ncbi:MAG: DUF2085 domain-containing protein [Acidobacteria bacterium]|nr:MAG: DUF2085 domain-containing protein [Acidobacteriota bacterium]REJ98725.1 MAG: DUF2085 domain-containing protein [Acidobacteriota bacterium]REK16620.1 MAG: DUF2085 domain-containing protein [Acidobacteriota bacterium]REK42531.1 MAG: DUF2085 domain-containing protein [Acidobacteriota bacterium]
MPETSSQSEYRSIEFLSDLRSRSRLFLAGMTGIAAVWAILILAAPVAAASALESLSGPLYDFFGYVCHQLPDRSFHLLEHKLAVCSRCSGVYFGLLGGLLAYPFVRPLDNSDPLPRFWLFASMVPIAADWSLGYFGVIENSHFSRVITGLILGVGCAIFIAPALIELAEISLRRSALKSRKATS